MSIKIALTCFLVLVCYQHVSGRPPKFLKNEDPPVVGVYDTSNITVVSCLGTIMTSDSILVSRGCSHIPAERLFILDENEKPIFPIVFYPIFPDVPNEQDTDSAIGIMVFEATFKQKTIPILILPPLSEDENDDDKEACDHQVCYHTSKIENITSVGFTKEYPQSLVTGKISKIVQAPYKWLTENEEENDEVAELLFGYIDRPGFEKLQCLIGVNQMKKDEKTKHWTATYYFGIKINDAIWNKIPKIIQEKNPSMASPF